MLYMFESISTPKTELPYKFKFVTIEALMSFFYKSPQRRWLRRFADMYTFTYRLLNKETKKLYLWEYYFEPHASKYGNTD